MAETALVPVTTEISKLTPKQLRFLKGERNKALLQDLAKSGLDFTGKALANPALALVAAFVAVELLQKYPREDPIMPQMAGNVVEGVLSSSALASALGGAGGLASILTSLK